METQVMPVVDPPAHVPMQSSSAEVPAPDMEQCGLEVSGADVGPKKIEAASAKEVDQDAL